MKMDASCSLNTQHHPEATVMMQTLKAKACSTVNHIY